MRTGNRLTTVKDFSGPKSTGEFSPSSFPYIVARKANAKASRSSSFYPFIASDIKDAVA